MNEFLRKIKPIFVGSNGIRAGWRIAMFVAITIAISNGIRLLQNALKIHPHSDKVMLHPSVGIGEAIGFAIVVASAIIVSKISRRSFAELGLTLKGLKTSHLWVGLIWGFSSISVVLLVMFALHGFTITGVATRGNDLLIAAAMWPLVFLCVALFEEFVFRGYFQSTLASGLGKNGFWWATLITSLLFGAAHLGNQFENPIGLVDVVAFGLFMCLVLRQTGSLWFGIGVHASWDWGQSFFYGVRDSGTTTWHPFLTSAFQGPVWLTGGTAGPEGSILTLLVLVASSALILRLFPNPAIDLPFWPQKALATAESV